MFTLFISSFFILTHRIAGTAAASENELPSNYQLFLDTKNWVDAELFCQERGGHLISIHDEVTNLQIANYLLTALPSHTSYSWIGFNQIDQTWTDNSPHDYTPGLDQNPQGECTTIDAGSDPIYRGYWMGPPCNNAYPFICDIPPIPETQCNHLNGLAMNVCSVLVSEEAEGPQGSYKSVCIDENTVEDRTYSGLNCDETQLSDSYQLECTAENDCYCAATDETECDTIDVTVTHCLSNQKQFYTFVADKCLSGESNSQSHHCKDNGEFVWQSYNNINCQPSESDTEEIYPTSCQPDAPIAVTCSLNEEGPNSVDRITSDCIGNEIERETVTIDECQFEQFPNGPARPYKFFCDDNNELGLKYYTRGIGNCDGKIELQTILDSNGQCSDGYIFSSTCGGIAIIPVEPIELVQRITLDCEGNIEESQDVTTNQCEMELFSDGPARPYKYFCDSNNKLGLKYYIRGSGGCNGEVDLETILDSNGQCIDGNIFASTCGGISIATTSKQPISTLVSRLCTEELQQFNVGAIYLGTGGCQQHFDAILSQDSSGSASFADCLAKCEEKGCKSFAFGKKGVSRENWCNVYSEVCSIGSDHHWYMFTPINNAETMCNSIP